MKFLIMVDIFSIFLFEKKIYCQDRFQKLSLQTNWIFFANRVIYLWNKLSNKIKNNNNRKNFKIELDDFSNNGKKKEFKRSFLGTIGWII